MCTLSFSLCAQIPWKPGMTNTSKSSWQPGISSECLWQLTVTTNSNYTHNSLQLWPCPALWSDLSWNVVVTGEIKIPAEFCQNDLNLKSDFKVLLPRRQGPGLCSTALVSYLIALHNDLVYCVDKHTGEETRWGRSCHIYVTCTCLAEVCELPQMHTTVHLCVCLTERLLTG